MENAKEFLYGENFKKSSDLFNSKLSEWKEQNKQLLIENNLEDSYLFTSTIPGNFENPKFDDSVPEFIRDEIRNLIKSCLPTDQQDQ